MRHQGATECQCKDFMFIQSETKNNPHLNALNRVVTTQLRCSVYQSAQEVSVEGKDRSGETSGKLQQ